MRPGRSSSDRRPRRGGAAAILCLALMAALPGAAARSAESARDSVAGPAQPRPPACPRCGYRNEPDHRFCVACGWDLRTLVGAAAQRQLEAIGRSVVGLVVTKENQRLDQMMPPKYAKWLRYLGFGTGETGRTRHFGSAFAYGGPGLFATGARLLERAVEVRLRTHDNRQFAAEIVAHDVASGVGFVRAEVPGMLPLSVSARTPQPPEAAWVVCYPVAIEERLVHYLPQSLHRGRITAVGQTGTGLVSFEDLLRTDHAIPHGCAGGPLVDLHGGVSGMALLSPEPGLTYAVPGAGFREVAEILARGERPQWPYFGIGLFAPDGRRRARFGLDESVREPVVGYLVPRSPAETAGVRPGDLLIAVQGEAAATVPQAGRLLLRAAPGGNAVRLTVRRRGQDLALAVPPGRRPERILLAPADELQETLEANLEEVTTGPTSQHGLRFTGVVRGGRGENQGYRDGDLIVGASDKTLRRIDTLNDWVRSENVQVFGRDGTEGSSPIPMYITVLEVRPADGGEKEWRRYANLYPFVFAPPVY